MSLKRSEINPLSLLGLRRLEFIPEHFATMHVSQDVDIRLLDHWINYHLNSRYAFSHFTGVDDNNKIFNALKIGMEDPGEITMLTLGCPYI
jgi:hypothetical protein